jgi:hypothetical protein
MRRLLTYLSCISIAFACTSCREAKRRSPGTGSASASSTAGASLISAVLDDWDSSGSVSEGDWLTLTFSQDVVTSIGVRPEDFALPVLGDSLGSGASVLVTVSGAPPDNEVDIVLGKNPRLTIAGTFDPKKLSPGASSGIDVTPTILIRDREGRPVRAGPVDIRWASP